MKTEKVVLSFIAALFGLIVAFVAYYFYQSSKVVPQAKQTVDNAITTAPTPTPDNSFFLTVDNLNDQSVTASKTLSISGKTSPNATITVITPTDQQVVSPSSTGGFSVSTTIGDGANIVEITAISPSGEEKKITRTITFSTESF